MFSANRRVKTPLLASVLLLPAVALGQQSPPSAMQMTITSVPPTGANGRIYVNENCGILPDLTLLLTAKQKKEVQFDPVVCHVEGVVNSQHEEEEAVGDALERVRVEVREQEFELANITLKPVVFYVLVAVPKGWAVDSDPPPKETKGDVAIFEAHAAAGEFVRLHVGMRHSKDLKPRSDASPTAP